MLVHPLVIVIPLFRRVSSRFKVSLGQQLSSALPAVASTAAMTAIVLLLQLTVLAGKPPAARLLVASSVGALTVAGVLMLAFPERLRVLRALVQQRSIEEEPPPG
jgi:hypothetical protein